MAKKVLGILGGMGPAASARFYTLLTQFTKAASDSEHMKILLTSATDIPDRTAFILGKSGDNPLPKMQKAAKELAEAGAELIAVPCNTAEYFHADLQKLCPVPVLRTVHESCKHAARLGVRKLGIMATEGTVHAQIYQKALAEFGIDFALPSERGQATLNGIIYGALKKSLPPDKNGFRAVAEDLALRGCDAIVLGCTELSLIPLDETDKKYHFIDSLEVLAKKSIVLCGYKVKD